MKPILTTVIPFVIFSAATVFAAGTKPSEASIRELLSLSGAPKMLEMSRAQMAGMVGAPLQQALQGHDLTPEVKKIVADSGEKMSALLAEAMKWEALEPLFIELYQEAMTQEEVDGIVAFYKTPAGKAMVEKMPALMRASGPRLQLQA